MSTIASEDAEEEEKAVRELDNASEVQSEETPEVVTAEEKETSQEPTATETRATPTSTAESTTLESADNSKTPDVEVTPGNSLVEAMTQTMASVVTAVEETVLGERPADETTTTEEAEDVSDSTGSVQQKPVPAEATETAEGKENDTVDSLQTQTIPEIVEPGKTDSDVQSESAPLPNPTYTMAIVGNKYNTQNFW